MVRIGLRERNNGTAMGMHSVTVQRRSGDTFSPIPVGGLVLPGEPVRYRSDGGNLPYDVVRFRVIDATGNVVFDQAVNLNGLLSGWTDTVAPAIVGPYTLTAEVRTYPFLTFTHFADTQWVVSTDAPNPPPPPPEDGLGGFLSSIKGILLVGTILVVAATVIPRILPRR